MPRPIQQRDIRTTALVLRRTNYGEADRILNLITPDGLVALLAKGVRREKSKLAGGIELFCLSEITYHQKSASATGLAILTSARMQKFYQRILTDFDKMNLASTVLKKVAHAAEHTDGREFYELTKSTLEALDRDIAIELIETYFWLNFAKAQGQDINFSRDTSGARLQPDQRYLWHSAEEAFAIDPTGPYAADDIKYLRLMLSSSLALCARVKYPKERLPELLYIAKAVNML